MFTTKVIYTAGTECTLAIFCTGARPYCAAECICEQIAAPAGPALSRRGPPPLLSERR